MSSVRLTWDNPYDEDFSYVEIWECEEDDPTKAVLIAKSKEESYLRVGLEPNTTMYYWFKTVDVFKNVSDFHDISGIKITTKDLPALQAWNFLTSGNRIAKRRYISSKLPNVLTVFSTSDIGKRGYDMDSKTFWDVADVIDGEPVWTSASILNDTIQFFGNKVTGTVPKLIQTKTLSAGSYPAPSALLGCIGSSTGTATLEFRRPASGIVLAKVEKIGELGWSSGSGFSLADTAHIDIVLYAGSDTQTALVNQIIL